jgi:lipopolysaccharide transport system permease protein
VQDAFNDAIDGLKQYRLWSHLGWQDLLARYRRSWLGPLWIIASAMVFIGALSVVYGSLFKTDLASYIPIVAIGLAVWNFIAGISGESVTAFVESESYIRQIRLSYFVYVLRVVWRNILVFLNQFTLSIAVVIFFGTLELRLVPLVILGVLLLFAQALWVVPLMGILGSRYRDLQPVIQNALLVFFLVTPIFWSSSLLGDRQFIADFNPFNHLIVVVREPMLGNVPSALSYIVVTVGTIIGFSVAAYFYRRFRGRIVYWL